MELQNEIYYIEMQIKKQEKNLISLKEKFDELKIARQPTNDELYQNIKSFFDLSIINKEYEYILGGDGRSQPWSENRTGIVAIIKIKDGIYLNPYQLQIINDFVINTNEVEHTEIIYKL